MTIVYCLFYKGDRFGFGREYAIKSFASLLQLESWLDRLRAELPLQDVIEIVTAKMQLGDIEDQYHLALNLKWLFVEAERDREALPVLDKMIERIPDDVRFAISKASLYFYSLDDPQEALRCIDMALERANRTGFFRREALGVKARILLQLGRGEQLSHVLEEIMSVQITKGVPDVGRERDFVDRAPPGLIREDIVARYNLFRPKRAGDSTADEPPEYEPPE